MFLSYSLIWTRHGLLAPGSAENRRRVDPRHSFLSAEVLGYSRHLTQRLALLTTVCICEQVLSIIVSNVSYEAPTTHRHQVHILLHLSQVMWCLLPDWWTSGASHWLYIVEVHSLFHHIHVMHDTSNYTQVVGGVMPTFLIYGATPKRYHRARRCCCRILRRRNAAESCHVLLTHDCPDWWWW